MKITYVGRFDQLDSNDDEGSVLHALRELGHEVTPVRQEMASRWIPKMSGELLLWNKWLDAKVMEAARDRFGCLAFWYWDMVWHDDPSLRLRCQNRTGWMDAVMPLVDVGFCTDGDWVLRCNQGFAMMGKMPDVAPLIWLPQGADERVAGMGKRTAGGPDILFTGGSRGCGALRESFVTMMRARYGSKFYHVERGVHGETLKDLIASSKIVVAPDGPVTDSYWSNRVYNALGFGAFLLHPSCFELSRQYMFMEELLDYENREQLNDIIAYWLPPSQEKRRLEIAEAGLRRTLAEHTYRHRVEQLIAVVKERMR